MTMTEPIERHEMLDVEKAWAENFGATMGRPPDAAERINFLRSIALEHQKEADAAEDRAGPEGGHLIRARECVSSAEANLDHLIARSGDPYEPDFGIKMFAALAQAHAAIALAERV